jgi:hypothetical protein
MSYPDDCHFSYITKMKKKKKKKHWVHQPFFLLAKVHQKEKLKINKMK